MKTKSENPRPIGTEAEVFTAQSPAPDIDTLRKELAGQKDLYLRQAADFENFRRRSREESAARAAAQKESFMKELLPVIDNLERALASGAAADVSPLHEGVKMTLQQLHILLRQHGVEPEESLGQVFDAHRHEAISQEHAPAQPAHSILKVFQRGYRKSGQVFRPAEVIVNKVDEHEPGIPRPSIMPAEFKDYYRVLGVSAKATDDDIKKAFRSLARKYHPDVAKDKKSAEEKFKEINEANEVLSNPASRQKYDQLEANWKSEARSHRAPGHAGSQSNGHTSEPEYEFEGTGFSDFFEQFFGGSAKRSRGASPFGQSGTAHGNEDDQLAPKLRGQDIQGDILITLDEVLKGAIRVISLRRLNARTGREETETHQVRIPVGVQTGQSIRVTGKGGEGRGGGRAGDIYLRVRFAQHPDWQTRDSDLVRNLELAPWEAVLGATVSVKTLEGNISLKVPAGTQQGNQLRVRGKGLPIGASKRGDLYVVISIQIPSTVNKDEENLWKQLATQSSFNPRKTP